MLEPTSLWAQGRGVPGQRQGGQGFGGGSACPPGTGSEAKVIGITQAKPPTLAGIACIMSQFTVRSPPGPRLPPLLHGVNSRRTQRKKHCVTSASNNPEDDFETWENVYYVSEKKTKHHRRLRVVNGTIETI